MTQIPSTHGKSAAPKPLLSWSRMDIENKLFFKGGHFTNFNTFLTLIVAVALTVLFYALLLPVKTSYFAEMFTDRGYIPYAIVFTACWALAILLVKRQKLALQKRAFKVKAIPERFDFVITTSNVKEVLDHIYLIADDPKRFVLLNRIIIALSNLRNLGRIGDVDDMLRAQADNDESAMDTTFSLLGGLIWAIPVLGFIGTVIGLSKAIGGFGEALKSVDADGIAGLKESLMGVTGGLSTAFETTLEALVAALIIQLILTFQKKAEEEFLENCSNYCLSNVVGRLRITNPKSAADSATPQADSVEA